MSSNQTKAEKRKRPGHSGQQLKRMTSITRKLHWYWIRKRILLFFSTDLLFFILLCVGWCADQEYTALRKIDLSNHRSFTISGESFRSSVSRDELMKYPDNAKNPHTARKPP